MNGPPEDALQHGQTAGTVLDLNGDGVHDILAVDLEGNAWALFGAREVGRARGVTICLPAKAPAPATVTVRDKDRRVVVVKPMRVETRP